jgi:hypothetical protein
MRVTLAIALSLLPAMAFAQMFEGPNGQIPVRRCLPVVAGAACTAVLEGSGLTAASGYSRVDRWNDVATSQQAVVRPGQAATPVVR